MQFLDQIATLLYHFIEFYIYIIIIYIIMGFFYQARMSKFYGMLRSAVEPYLDIFNFASYQGISFAPILGYLTLQLILSLLDRVFYIYDLF